MDDKSELVKKALAQTIAQHQSLMRTLFKYLEGLKISQVDVAAIMSSIMSLLVSMKNANELQFAYMQLTNKPVDFNDPVFIMSGMKECLDDLLEDMQRNKKEILKKPVRPEKKGVDDL
jgi:hypothetical protein